MTPFCASCEVRREVLAHPDGSTSQHELPEVLILPDRLHKRPWRQILEDPVQNDSSFEPPLDLSRLVSFALMTHRIVPCETAVAWSFLRSIDLRCLAVSLPANVHNNQRRRGACSPKGS